MQRTLISGLLLAVSAVPAWAVDLDVTLVNLTHGSHFTPLLVAAHGDASHLFEVGQAASASLQAMAEGGDISGLTTDLEAVGANIITNPADGLLAPGASTHFMLSTTDGNGYLSAVAMVLPTNDGFVGLNALKIPAAPGTYHYYLNAYDAGTEANDEIVNGGGAPGTPGIPADPLGKSGMNGTGVTTEEANQSVHVHRGVLGDTNQSGGISDLDSRVHRWLNPVARIDVTIK